MRSMGLLLGIVFVSLLLAHASEAQVARPRASPIAMRSTVPALVSTHVAMASANAPGPRAAPASPSVSRALDRELLRLQITVPILAVSGTLLALWPLVGWPRTIEDGSCGGVITPVVAGPVVAVSAALVALASVRKRRYHREGQTALPRTVRQRFARGIGIGLLTFVIGSGVAGPLFVDSLCYT